MCGNGPPRCNNEDDAHAYFFRKGFWPIRRIRHTAMYVGGPGVDRDDIRMITHYSNPDVEVRNAETGAANADNAAQIRSTACQVAGFRTETDQPLMVNITGPANSCPCTLIQFTATADNAAIGTIVYSWERSIDGGITFTPLSSTGPTISHYTDCGDDDFGSALRVTITDAMDRVASATVFVSTNNPPSTCGGGNGEPGGQHFGDIQVVENNSLRTTENQNLVQPSDGIVIYPNPARSAFTITLAAALNCKSIKIRSTSGRVVWQRFGSGSNLPAQNYNVQLLPKGFYVVEVLTNNGVIRKQLIIG